MKDDMKAQEYYAYMVRCRDGSYYAGYTVDVQRRVTEHNAGTASKYTRSRRPVVLIYCERFASKSAAMSREHALKQLPPQEKARLAQVPWDAEPM